MARLCILILVPASRCAFAQQQIAYPSKFGRHLSAFTVQMAPKQRVGMLRGLVNYVNRDGNALASDLLALGFLPENVEHAYVAAALEEAFQQQTSTGANFLDAVRHIANALNDYDFQMPSYYARLMRALASLEGTAKRLDPTFQVFARVYPYVLSQVLSDKSEEMRNVLSSMIITQDNRIRWDRMSRLLSLAVEDSSSCSGRASEKEKDTSGKQMHVGELENMQESIVEALEEAVDYIGSDEGAALRQGLTDDIAQAIESALLQPRGSTVFDSEHATQTASAAVRMIASSPNVWVPMLIRIALHKGTRRVIGDIGARLAPRMGLRGREALTLAISGPVRRL